MKKCGRGSVAAITCATTIVISAVVAYSQTAPSVPNLIAYQGLVTLAGGSPVANGSYPATFTIYNYSSGGASLWTESANVTTNGGRFSHNLGSVSALPSTLSFSNDSLWLAVTFNGELLTPRSRIVGNAYSLTANNLEGNNGSGIVSLRATANSHQISQYGSDGGEQMRLWGPSYAELVMDGNAIDNSTDDVLLSTNAGAGSILRLRKPGGTAGVVLHSGSAGAGGSLTLTNDAGTQTIFMDGDLSSDASVQLPVGAVSSIENNDEPGVASDIAAGIVTFPNFTVTTLASRTITAPANGYVLAIATCEARIQHEIRWDSVDFGISTSAASLPASQHTSLVLSWENSGEFAIPVTVHGLFSVSAGATTFYFLADTDTSTWTATDRKLSLIYVPTSYGSIDALSASASDAELTAAADPRTEAETSIAANEDRVNRELELMRAQAVEQAERIRKLEEAVQSQQDRNLLENPEN